MKLTLEHIGRMIKYTRSDGIDVPVMKLLDIGEADYWVEKADGSREAADKDWLWYVVEPKKKPSERIIELIGNTCSDPEWQERAITSIVQFLDEQAEKQ